MRASVRDAVVELLDELPRVGRITFRRLTSGLAERLEIIVRFLAVLELFKQGLVDIAQGQTFGRIEITWLGEDDTLARDRLMREAEAYDDPGPADEIDLREPQPEEAEQ